MRLLGFVAAAALGLAASFGIVRALAQDATPVAEGETIPARPRGAGPLGQ
jgi:hypothetical protein